MPSQRRWIRENFAPGGRIYGGPSYQMGATDATAPITTATVRKAKAALLVMRASLGRWLNYRITNDRTGVTQDLAAKRAVTEQRIATKLYSLLCEVFDSTALPSPDVSANPNAAVELAQIAMSGQLPSSQSSPGAQGFSWVWPVVAVVGIVAFVIITKINSDADLAAQQEHDACIQSGACTDYGFWLKAGGVAMIAWLAWDKFGLRELATRKRKRLSEA